MKEPEKKLTIKRLVELQSKRKLKPTEKKEYENLLDDVTVFYNYKRKTTTVSGAGRISLWFRYIQGNKKWKKDTEKTVKDILEFEKNYGVRLSQKDLDNDAPIEMRKL